MGQRLPGRYYSCDLQTQPGRNYEGLFSCFPPFLVEIKGYLISVLHSFYGILRILTTVVIDSISRVEQPK